MVDFAEIEKTALNDVEKYSKIYEEAALFNTEKVMKAFRNHMVSDYYLKPTTGYAYSDVGRENLDVIPYGSSVGTFAVCKWHTCAGSGSFGCIACR